MGTHNFLVERSNLANTSIEATTKPSLESGQVLIRVERYALTANNITYGVAGDMIGYWQFFPASGDLGRIPVWGIGTVVESQCAEVEPGTRYYGYYPMSSFLVIEPKKVNDRGLFDGAEHRAALPPTYNQYSLMTAENGYPAAQDNHQMIYRPLFTTGFVLDDFFADNDFFGAKQIVLSSASSKTSFSMAYLLKSRGILVIGLTSKGNADFVTNMGLYDEVVTYDNVASMDAGVATAYVDMSGNREVLGAIHNHFNSNLVNSCGVGITHYDARGGQDPKTLPGAAPSMFFAPSQIQKRHAEWGAEKFQGLLAEAWARFIADVDQWVAIIESDNVEGTYRTVLEGAAPDKAYIVVNAE